LRRGRHTKIITMIPVPYEKVAEQARKIETELKRLRRWQTTPLPPEKFENMGAFGSKTMAFEQWIQFVLLERIREIVESKDTFPSESNVAAYAARSFDGDPEAGNLQDLLSGLDQLINGEEPLTFTPDPDSTATQYSPELGTIPEVVFTLAGLLHQFQGDDLESQLQTFDGFLFMLAPSQRPIISDLVAQAAKKAADSIVVGRLEKAAQDIASGLRAAAPYDHAAAMRKYTEEHKKNFPASE